MSAALTHEEFSKHLNTKFRIQINETETVDAELMEVSEKLLSPRQERFSILFRTSNEIFLGQGMRRLLHDQMETLELFLVPMGRDEAGTSYEAVFNRIVKQ